jgi:hypothetical protein
MSEKEWNAKLERLRRQVDQPNQADRAGVARHPQVATPRVPPVPRLGGRENAPAAS